MTFEWDPIKAEQNLKKHDVSFDEASTVFNDPLSITYSDHDELRPEYDETVLQGGVRGKYIKRYNEGTNVVLLAPDVAAAFPSSEAVNEALRLLMKIAKASIPQPTGAL